MARLRWRGQAEISGIAFVEGAARVLHALREISEVIVLGGGSYLALGVECGAGHFALA